MNNRITRDCRPLNTNPIHCFTKGLDTSEVVDWTPEEVVVREPVSWIPTNQQPPPLFQELR